jgi:hypothetical protein
VSIPPGIHQESTRNARNSWVILGLYPYYLNSSRNPPGILPFLQDWVGSYQDWGGGCKVQPVVVYQIHKSVLCPSPTASWGLNDVSGKVSMSSCCP